MVHNRHLLLVLHTVPDKDRSRNAAFFWRSPEGVWKAGGAAKGNLQALRAHLEEFSKVAQGLEDQVDRAQGASDYFAVLQASAPLLRTSRNQHRTLQEAREAVPEDQDLINLRDQAGETERTLELVYGDAKNGLDYTTAKRAEEQAQISAGIAKAGHRLNLLAALFYPITAIGTLLGVNLQNGLETWSAPWPFWGFLGLSLLVGLTLRRSLEK